jgi:hypothetical protein
MAEHALALFFLLRISEFIAAGLMSWHIAEWLTLYVPATTQSVFAYRCFLTAPTLT